MCLLKFDSFVVRMKLEHVLDNNDEIMCIYEREGWGPVLTHLFNMSGDVSRSR